MSKKRLWSDDHALVSVGLPPETDKWKRIKIENPSFSEGVDFLYQKVTSELQKTCHGKISRDIINVLSDISACARCTLRFLSIRDWNVYSAPEELLFETFRRICANFDVEPLSETRANVYTTEEIISPRESPTICPLCFDLLRFADKLDCVWPICEKYYAHDYKVTDFNLNIVLPSGVIVKNHSALIRIQRLAAFTGDYVVDLKAPYKSLLGSSIQEALGLQHSSGSKFLINVEYCHPETQENHRFLTRVSSANFQLKKIKVKGKDVWTGDSRQNIAKALAVTGDDDFIEYGEYPPTAVTERFQILTIRLEHSPIFVGGRYLKLSRDISQTPWVVSGSRLTEKSVSECIGEILREKYRCDDYNFVSAGREDANVRMLGNGRPFYLGLINPREPCLSQHELNDAEMEIAELSGKLIRAHKLKPIDECHLPTIKTGEESKYIFTSMLVWLSKMVSTEMVNKLNEIGTSGITIDQWTPIRVLQRRALMVRKKRIHNLLAEALGEHFLRIELRTEAGTYIKEFIHGDLGRTTPSLGNLVGCDADILELDVIDVELAWPPED
ncbi:4467_t:CDS:10 [Paraglomus occultum]|uniref:tRNA pseudouridine(55) synthase n=1 Tax=Paraglomus occultum TaxID=144539 RepID=A0A9N9D7P2_9GLOM|nr:4467_t:CDS:10 [Paraglomus occultum]